jgi:thioredoxin reductase (NADPH)
MVDTVQKHIKSLNWGYKTDVIKLKIKYFNAYASFIDQHTIQVEDAKGVKTLVTAERIIIAVGGRPSYPGIPGDKEFGITSDDLFSMKKPPGKTLVVGASYVALECAGFLTAMGFDTTVMVRSIFLRGFDQDMAEMIAQHMEWYHTKFIRGATPVSWKADDGTVSTGEFDTVLFAIGRYAVTQGLNLAAAGVSVEANGKFNVNELE